MHQLLGRSCMPMFMSGSHFRAHMLGSETMIVRCSSGWDTPVALQLAKQPSYSCRSPAFVDWTETT